MDASWARDQGRRKRGEISGTSGSFWVVFRALARASALDIHTFHFRLSFLPPLLPVLLLEENSVLGHAADSLFFASSVSLAIANFLQRKHDSGIGGNQGAEYESASRWR